MHKILKHIGYEVCDKSEAHNKKLNHIDYFFCLVYMVISLINALMGVGALKLVEVVDEHFTLNNASMKTFLLILINAVVLIRLNIRLYIECKDKELKAQNELEDSQKDCVKIRIKALDKRLAFLRYCYYADIIIFLINIIFVKNGIESSLSVIIILPIILTFCNNMIDIAKNKYFADEKITYEFSSLEGVTINGNQGN